MWRVSLLDMIVWAVEHLLWRGGFAEVVLVRMVVLFCEGEEKGRGVVVLTWFDPGINTRVGFFCLGLENKGVSMGFGLLNNKESVWFYSYHKDQFCNSEK